MNDVPTAVPFIFTLTAQHVLIFQLKITCWSVCYPNHTFIVNHSACKSSGRNWFFIIGPWSLYLMGLGSTSDAKNNQIELTISKRQLLKGSFARFFVSAFLKWTLGDGRVIGGQWIVIGSKPDRFLTFYLYSTSQYEPIKIGIQGFTS